MITTGVTVGRFRVESSVFRGAEPDENRHDIEMGKLDSWSSRLGFTPTRDWSLQVSHGHLADPEAARPGDIERTTASVAHNRAWHDGNAATALIWGRNHEEHGNFNSYLLESTVNFRDANYLYSRLELLDKAGLLEENVFGRPGRIAPETHSDGDSFRYANNERNSSGYIFQYCIRRKSRGDKNAGSIGAGLTNGLSCGLGVAATAGGAAATAAGLAVWVQGTQSRNGFSQPK